MIVATSAMRGGILFITVSPLTSTFLGYNQPAFSPPRYSWHRNNKKYTHTQVWEGEIEKEMRVHESRNTVCNTYGHKGTRRGRRERERDRQKVQVMLLCQRLLCGMESLPCCGGWCCCLPALIPPSLISLLSCPQFIPSVSSLTFAVTRNFQKEIW